MNDDKSGKSRDGAVNGMRPPEPPLTKEMKAELRAAQDRETARKKARRYRVECEHCCKIAYSVQEAAFATGMSEWLIREAIDKGAMSYCKIRSRIIIPRYEIERLILEHLVKRKAAIESPSEPEDLPPTTPRPKKPTPSL